MWNWLVRLWLRMEKRLQGEKQPPQVYHRSNLHGRHR